MKLVIVGNPGGTNVGQSFVDAADDLGIEVVFNHSSSAYSSFRWLRSFDWHCRGKYPSHLKRLSEKVKESCTGATQQLLLTTGIAPISASVLQKLGLMGVRRFNFLTDDPWNHAHWAPWFFKALPHYDIIFSPRRANVEDLRRIGCTRVEYLPFGYDQHLFYPPDRLTIDETSASSLSNPDVIFAGAADSDRVPYMHALIQSNLHVALYGSYWERYAETRPHSLGQAEVSTLRLGINTAKVALCLVRRANRDGHCMRTFEVPAVGGASMLTEDTPEHREIFGPEGEAVLYFNTLAEMVSKTHWLLAHDQERQRLAAKAHRLVTQGGHSYQDRLKTMLTYCQN